MSQLRPCDSTIEYGLCYHPYVFSERTTPDPEHLICPRYYAFTMQDADYLIRTWHPSYRTATLRAELMTGFAHTEWSGLTVFEHCWQDADNIGFVSFVARFTEDDRTGAIIERSRFLRENGQWCYIDGTRPQFSRNDPYPCDSGKKFKRCCGQ